MTNVEINTYLAFGYLGWIIAYLITWVSLKDRNRLSRIFWSAFLVLWFVHTGSIALRWAESYWMGIGHAPLSNLYESLVFFSWSVALGLLVVWKKFGEDVVPLFGAPMVFLILSFDFFDRSKHKTSHTCASIQLAGGSCVYMFSRLRRVCGFIRGGGPATGFESLREDSLRASRQKTS